MLCLSFGMKVLYMENMESVFLKNIKYSTVLFSRSPSIMTTLGELCSKPRNFFTFFWQLDSCSKILSHSSMTRTSGEASSKRWTESIYTTTYLEAMLIVPIMSWYDSMPNLLAISQLNVFLKDNTITLLFLYLQAWIYVRNIFVFPVPNCDLTTIVLAWTVSKSLHNKGISSDSPGK